MAKNYRSPSSLTEYCDPKNLPVLKPHLLQWIEVLKDYQKKVGDSPFRYLERTHIGFFAAASWMVGDPALEEWHTIKGTMDQPIKGRCDLWILTESFHIEAKYCWCEVGRSPARELKRIQGAVDSAVSSAKKLDSEVENALAFTFLTPCVDQENQDRKHELTTEWLDLAMSIEADAIAWYMPERAMTEHFDYPRLALGTALLINRISRDR